MIRCIPMTRSSFTAINSRYTNSGSCPTLKERYSMYRSYYLNMSQSGTGLISRLRFNITELQNMYRIIRTNINLIRPSMLEYYKKVAGYNETIKFSKIQSQFNCGKYKYHP